MRHIPEGNPFQASDPFPGASAGVRRALSQMNTEHPSIQRIDDACKALKLKAKYPVYEDNAVAHIGIPAKKVAIYFRGFGDRGRIDVAREKWEALGWKMLAVTPQSIEKTPTEALIKHLGEAIQGLKK